MGFVLDNKLLIVAGALDGSSGFILSVIMCKAMNRSFTNVLFGAFGQVAAASAAAEAKAVKSATPQDVADILENASSVVVVPGYGMAVAQAQHRVRELYEQLTKRGIECRFAIHPVAGRMPGHMNVLLAEAEVPYTALAEMDDINPDMPQVDVVIVVGANDVVNPAARHDKSSPIFGMPIINADKAKTVIAIKRSMNPGFAGIENELYSADNCLMAFRGCESRTRRHREGHEWRRRHSLNAMADVNRGGSTETRRTHVDPKDPTTRTSGLTPRIVSGSLCLPPPCPSRLGLCEPISLVSLCPCG